MAPRVPRLPKAKPTEVVFVAAAGAAVLAPLYMIMPGAEQRLETQTTKWAPRWEKNISYFTPPVERGVQRIEPPVSRTVQNLEQKLPLEQAAQYVDGKIRAAINKVGGGPSSSSSA